MRHSPHELAEQRLELSAEYGRYSEELEIVLLEKPRTWRTLRGTVKSDTAADRLWEETDQGRDEIRLRLRMKALDKKFSAIKTMLDVYQGEARNQF